MNLTEAVNRLLGPDPLQEREMPYGAKLKSEIPKQPPKKLWHVTLFASKIMSGGFKSRSMLGNTLAVLGGGSSDSVSFTDNREFAAMYANGLRASIASTHPSFDPWDLAAWGPLLKKYGFPSAPMSRVWEWKEIEKHKARGRWSIADASFELLQGYSMETRKFPLFMGGSWPDSILRAKLSDVAVLEISSDGPQWWDYHSGEKEFRIFDVENIGRAKKVG